MKKLLLLMFALWSIAGFAQCVAPTITAVTVSSITTRGATISWTTTGVSSDSTVFYAYNIDPYILYPVSSGVLQSGGVTSHSVTITGVDPGQLIWYSVRSRAICDLTKLSVWEGNTPQVDNNFTALPAPTSGLLDYWFRLNGGHHVMQGYDLSIGQNSGYISGSSNYTGTWKIVVTGLPANSQIFWPDVTVYGEPAYTVSTTTTPGDTINAVSPLNSITSTLQTNVGGTTPAGNYTLTYTATASSSGGNVVHTATWPVTVDAAATLASANPSSYPAITNLSTWQTRMTHYGAQWCLSTGAPLESKVWFYDGAWAFQRTRAYTNDSATWSPCVSAILLDWRGYLDSVNYNPGFGYRNFPTGLYNDYVLYGGATDSKTAIVGNPNGTGGLGNDFTWRNGFNTTIDYMRETALSVDSHRLRDHLNGVSPQPDTKLGLTILLGFADEVANGDGGAASTNAGGSANGPYESFIVGLMAESLIYYYNDGNQSDVRIPLAIKALADYMYAQAWNKFPSQPNGFIYASTRYYEGFDDTTGGNYQPTLNNLVAPLYAWLFKYTGNATYQTEGDSIFNNSDAANPAYNADNTLGDAGNGGKAWAQNYRWSFDYVAWRTAPVNSGSIALTPASYLYPNTLVGANKTTTFVLANTTPSAVTISSQAVTGTGFSLIGGSSTCFAGMSLGPANQCTLTVQFTPASAAAFSGTLTVVTSGPTLTSTFTGTGFALAPTPYPVRGGKGRGIKGR